MAKLPNRTLFDEMNYRFPSAVTPRCDPAEVEAAAALSGAVAEADLLEVGPLPSPSVVDRRRGRRAFEVARFVGVTVAVAAVVVFVAGLFGYGAAVARLPRALPPADLGGYRLAVPGCDPDKDVCSVVPR